MIYNIGSRIVNNYLVSFDAGFILVDTGYEGGFPHFLKKLEKHHIQPEEIKYLLLTHAHDDHAGFLNEVLEATGAEVILNRKAIDGLKRGQNSFEGGCSSILAWLFCQVLILLGHGNHRYPAIKDEYLKRLIPIDSDRFGMLGFPYEILETPGHTSDHISLLVDVPVILDTDDKDKALRYQHLGMKPLPARTDSVKFHSKMLIS